MGNTAFTLLILFLLSTCLLLEVVHTDNSLENYPHTEFKFKKVDDDWVVDLSNANQQSIDVSKKIFQLQFDHALEEKSVIFCSLETTTPLDKNNWKLNLHHAQYNVVLSMSKVLFTPASKFPVEDLMHSRRLIIHVQPITELSNILLIDEPPADVFKEELFLSKVWDFYENITQLQVKDPSLILNVATPENFQKTFWNSPLFQPNSLPIDYTTFREPPPLDSPSRCFYNDKVLYDGANPNARLITLLSQEFSKVLLTLLRNRSSSSFLELCAHYRYLGQMIGMAIANGLPVDISFSRDFFMKVTEEPEHTMLSLVAKAFIHGPEAESCAIINAYCNAIWTVVPRDLLKTFDQEELVWLVNGRPTELIQAKFFKQWAKYEPGLSEDTLHIQWFWTYVESLDQSKLNGLWKMITGSPRLAARVHPYVGYYFMIVTTSLQRTHLKSIDSVPPVGIYNGADEPPLLYIPMYSSELVLRNNFDRIIQ